MGHVVDVLQSRKPQLILAERQCLLVPMLSGMDRGI